MTLRENRGLNWGGYGESDGSLEASPQPQKKSLHPTKKDTDEVQLARFEY